MTPMEISLAICLAAAGLVNGWLIFFVQALKTQLIKLGDADTSLSKELHESNVSFTAELAAVKVLIAGQYITRNEFHEGMRAQTAAILGGMERIVKHAPLANKGDD